MKKQTFTKSQIKFWMESAAEANRNEFIEVGGRYYIINPRTCEVVITEEDFVRQMMRGWH